ncbi:MAG TPA: biotin/lipoyl-containing protein [Propionibacteriaceae bacterium]|nr:biotin/lipoyl-containing protein [Propionibacteriaceae bacterium]
MKLKVTVNGVAYDIEVDVEENEKPQLGPIVIGGSGASAPQTASVPASVVNGVTAPLSGSVSKILVAEGDEIKAGQVLVVLEAMKMETEITAPADGKVKALLVTQGESVQGGQALVEFE